MAADLPAEQDPLRLAAAVMDRLRSPGGCPWDAAQTHASLARYLVEETYEVLEAIESDDPALLREELGDVLLQVLFHARLAQERTDGAAFGIDEVAGDLAAKLIRRHPHVFAAPDADAALDADSANADSANADSANADSANADSANADSPPSADEVNRRWEQQKAEEKSRTSAVDGVPMALPALALAGKLVSRARRAGLDAPIERAIARPPADAGERIGAALLAVVAEAIGADVDPETALRQAARRLRDDVITAEHDGR